MRPRCILNIYTYKYLCLFSGQSEAHGTIRPKHTYCEMLVLDTVYLDMIMCGIVVFKKRKKNLVEFDRELITYIAVCICI